MTSYSVFKYSPINKHFIDALLKGYIYCAQPQQLNDPFDCKVIISESIDRAIVASTGIDRKNLGILNHSEEFLSFINKKISDTGVCSFSKNLLKPVLWSHYANEHKGICCLYKFPSSFINWDVNKIIGMSEVDYGDNLITEAFLSMVDKLPDMDNYQIYKEITIPMLSSKGEDWHYEEEIKIVKDKPGPLSIEKNFLQQICFGLHTSDSDKELVRTIVDKSGLTPEFCEIRRTHSDFGIEAIDL